MNRWEIVEALASVVNEWIGRAVSWLTLTMVLVIFLVVILRYLFGLGWIALQESATYMHATVFMLGAAYALHHDAHVRVDLFYDRFSPRTRAWVNLGGHLLLLLPSCIFLFWISLEYVTQSWQVMEGSHDAGGLNLVWLLKSLLLITPLLLALQGLAQSVINIRQIRGKAKA